MRRRTVRGIVVLALVVTTVGATAAEEAETAGEEREASEGTRSRGELFRAGARHVKEDARYLITFPARPTRRGVIGSTAVGTGVVVLILLDDEIREEAQEARNDTLDRWEERIEPLGAARNTAIGAVATWGFGKLLRHEPTTETGRALIEALLFTESFDAAAKGLFGREKPGVGTSGDFFEGSSFFPSGHTARSFAVATVLAERHGRVAAWIAYPVATLVGLFRIESDAHWASDVLAGAALGHVIAKAVVSRRENRRAATARVSFRITPWTDPQRGAIGLALRIPLR